MKGFIVRFCFAEQVSIQTQTYLKRCFKEAQIEMAENPTNPYHQWFIKLDGKYVKTPYRNTLAVPSAQLAAQIVKEFNQQKEQIDYSTMPLMLMAKDAVDLDYHSITRDIFESSIINYLEKDTILRNDINRSQKNNIQQPQLDPLLKLFNAKFGMNLSHNFGSENEIKKQDVVKIESIIRGVNNWQLVCLESTVEQLQSCILSLLLRNNQLDVKKAIELAAQYNSQKESNQNSFLNVSSARLFAQLIQTQSIVY